MLYYVNISKTFFCAALAGVSIAAQVPPSNLAVSPAQMQTGVTSKQPAAQPAPERAFNYVLGPEDQIVIRAFQAEELSDKPIQIGGDGYINLPLVGRVKAAGLTVSQLESELVTRLGADIRNPQVSVFVADYRSQPVSVVGAVNTPGMVQLRGRKTLVEVVALAGGLRADAGNTVTVTRELANGRIPAPGAADDASGKYSIAQVNLQNVMNAQNPQANIVVQANDVVLIPRAQMVYVVGEVTRPGGYVLNERDSVSVLQALSLAGGLTNFASPKKAKILHDDHKQANPVEVSSNVRKILEGDAPDVPLHADDILFVPRSGAKTAGGKALETALNMAGIAIWKF